MPIARPRITMASALGCKCTCLNRRRTKASKMMYTEVARSSPVSTNAEKFSNFPWPYVCPESAGLSDTRTESHVRMAAIKSSPECSASDSTPRLPVATARNTFRLTRIIAEPMDPSAAICLTDVGDRVMSDASKGLYDEVAHASACGFWYQAHFTVPLLTPAG